LACGQHPHPDATGLPLLRRRDGPGEPAGVGTETVEHDGRRPCIAALEEAVAKHGRPEIFNTDQGSRFTSPRLTEVLTGAGERISMDERVRWMDDVFIERPWRSMKYEFIYLHAGETGSEACAGIGRWIGDYDFDRPHSTQRGRTPVEVHEEVGDIGPAA
jgi:putative transposase